MPSDVTKLLLLFKKKKKKVTSGKGRLGKREESESSVRLSTFLHVLGEVYTIYRVDRQNQFTLFLIFRLLKKKLMVGFR